MNKEQALRTIKLLSALEMYVFMHNDMPAHHCDELFTIINDLTDYILEKKNETY